MQKFEFIELEKINSIGIIWLNRDEVRNAFNDVMINEIMHALDHLNSDQETKVIVFAGRGKVFCAGADLNWMKKMVNYSEQENYDDALNLAKMLNKIYVSKKPTVARVHGHAFAGGMGLLCACDIAVANIEAEFCLSEVKIGLIPSTISPYVIRSLSPRASSRYMITAEKFSAAEAYRLGMLHEICIPDKFDEKIDEILTSIVNNAPMAMSKTKKLMNDFSYSLFTEAHIDDTAARIAKVRISKEGQEGINSFLNKSKPNWMNNSE